MRRNDTYLRDLPSRIMGQEIEYGAILRNADGSWDGIESGSDTTAVERFHAVGARYRPRPDENIIGFGSVWLPNGARAYLDVGHLEIASPECLTAKDVVLFSRATERIFDEAFRGNDDDLDIYLLRDNSDSRDVVSYAAHENYLVLQNRLMGLGSSLDPEILKMFSTFMVTRLLIAGNGSVEFGGRNGKSFRGRYYLSNRARHVVTVERTGATGSQKPIILLRNQSLSGVSGHYRLQLAMGDPNVLEGSEYLKFGTTHLVLRLLEHLQSAAVLPVFRENNVIRVMRQVNGDPKLRHRYHLRDNRLVRAIDIQREIHAAIARIFPLEDDPEVSASETRDLLELWAMVLDGLRDDVTSLAPTLDWVLKRELLDELLEHDYGIDLDGLRQGFAADRGNMEALYTAKALEQQFAEVHPGGLGSKLMRNGYADRVTTEEEIRNARSLPPGWDDPARRCRSWPRGRLLAWLHERGIPYTGGGAGTGGELWNGISIDDRRPQWMPEKQKLSDPFRWNYGDIERLYL